MRALFNRLQLRTRLVIGFGVIVGLVFFSDMLKTVGSGRTMAAAEQYFRTEDRIGNLALDGVAALEKARRLEREILQELRSGGGLPGADATQPLFEQMAALRAMMTEVRALRGDIRTAQRTRAVEAHTLSYERDFLRVLRLHGQLAYFAAASRALGDAVAGVAPLRAAWQALQAQERLYYLHAPEGGALATGGDAVADMRRQALRAALAPERRQAVLDALLRYSDSFAAATQVLREIDGATVQYMAAVREIEPVLDHLREQAAAAQAGVRERMRGATSVVAMVAGLAWVVNLVAAAAVLGWMARAMLLWCASARGLVRRPLERHGDDEPGLHAPHALPPDEFGKLLARRAAMA